MLEFIRIQRFKTLLDTSFPLSTCNLFSGLNGLGKSSLLQTLLLLRQSYERNTLESKGLLLKGDYLALGTGQDVLSEQAEMNSFEFTVKWQNQSAVQFVFDYVPNSDLQPNVKPALLHSPETLSLFNSHFQYLSAERIGPKTYYEISDFHINSLNTLGNHGEYTVHFIAENGQNRLPIPGLRHADSASANLLDNIDAWMSELSPGIQVHATLHPQLNSASLGYAFVQGKDVTADFKPQNVGFGLTFVLPVVTALLRAEPGDLLIIENPESHLHPAGQTIVGRLCALAAANGVQLFIESHSDHFLNGIRVAVRQNLINAELVSLFFLERDGKGAAHSTTVRNPSIDKQGRIDFWPEGFFDEWDRQLENLL